MTRLLLLAAGALLLVPQMALAQDKEHEHGREGGSGQHGPAPQAPRPEPQQQQRPQQAPPQPHRDEGRPDHGFQGQRPQEWRGDRGPGGDHGQWQTDRANAQRQQAEAQRGQVDAQRQQQWRDDGRRGDDRRGNGDRGVPPPDWRGRNAGGGYAWDRERDRGPDRSGWDRARDHRGWDRPVYRIGSGRPDGFNRIRASRFYYPSGYGYRRWTVGLILPSLFLSSAYYFDDWGDYGFGPPPYGYRWVRYGPDLLLVDYRNGRIADTIYGAFY